MRLIEKSNGKWFLSIGDSDREIGYNREHNVASIEIQTDITGYEFFIDFGFPDSTIASRILTKRDGLLSATLSAEYLSVDGTVCLQIKGVGSDGSIKKSNIILVEVVKSVDETNPQEPPVYIWTQYINQVAELRDAALEANKHAPKINENNNHWEIYNPETGEYEDTDVDAKGIQGERGEKGEQGERGEKGEQGDIGIGVPEGGTKGQVLSKKSNQDYDFEWTDNSDKINAYSSIEKIQDYYFETSYNNVDYDYAKKYFESDDVEPIRGGCSSFRIGNFYCRHLDWYYSECAEFKINIPRIGSHYANVGFAGNIKGLTNESVTNREYNKLYKVLPFYVLDGVNEKGVFCNANIVPARSTYSETEPTVETKDRICSIMLVRYILDNFATADEAIDYIKKYIAVYPHQKLIDMGYEMQFMLGDGNKTYAVELSQNNLTQTLVFEEANVLTNFRTIGVNFNDDGTVYTPADVISGHKPSVDNNIEIFGSGLERYNLIKTNIKDISDKNACRLLLNKLLYSRAYPDCRLEGGVANPFWFTEFVGVFDIGTYTVDTNPYYFGDIVTLSNEYYNERSRSNPKTWETTHSNIYDLRNHKIYTVVQENGIEYESDFGFYYDSETIDRLLLDKVDKESGKGLSTNDYTDNDKALVQTIEDKADADDVYTKTEVNTRLQSKAPLSDVDILFDILGDVPDDTDVQSEIDDLDERVTYLEEHGGGDTSELYLIVRVMKNLLKKAVYIVNATSDLMTLDDLLPDGVSQRGSVVTVRSQVTATQTENDLSID